MPVRPENRDKYPKDWKAISHRIRFVRAGGRCECKGECGRDPAHLHRHDQRCTARHLDPLPRWHVVLTTAHLNHDPSDCRDENLLAMCQACHLAYDSDLHAATRRARAGRSPEDGMLW